MAQFFTNFSEYTTDETPTGWTSRWVAPTSFLVVADGAATGGKVLRIVKEQARSLLSFDAINGDANRDNIEVLLRCRATTISEATTQIGVAARASGAATSENGYRGNFSTATQLAQGKYVSGASTPLGNAVKSWTVDTWHWLRFQCTGTTVRSKSWTGAISSEPGSWDISATDSDISAAGWAGVFMFGASTYDVDLIGVGTGGDSAPSEAPASSSETVEPANATHAHVATSPTIGPAPSVPRRIVVQRRVAGVWTP